METEAANKKKTCKKCGEEKGKEDFPRGWSPCKQCDAKTEREKRNTRDGFLNCIFQNAKMHAKVRLEKGRVEAGICDITRQDIDDLWETQEGKCYYSNIPMVTRPNSDWQCSLERLDQELGYIKSNIALCCSEFNGNRTQWSHGKIRDMMMMLSEKREYVPVDFNPEKKLPRKVIYVTEHIIDGVKHYKCTYCNEIKREECFSAQKCRGCKDCRSRIHKERDEEARKVIQNMLSNASTRTKIRNSNKAKQTMHLRVNEFDLDFDFLVNLFHAQKGKCAYSGIPLSFLGIKNTNFRISLERKYSLKGYTKENVCFIAYEFNTGDKTCMTKDRSKGSCGWNKEKFDYFYLRIVEEFIKS